MCEYKYKSEQKKNKKVRKSYYEHSFPTGYVLMMFNEQPEKHHPVTGAPIAILQKALIFSMILRFSVTKKQLLPVGFLLRLYPLAQPMEKVLSVKLSLKLTSLSSDNNLLKI